MDRYIIGTSSSGKTRRLFETATELNAVVVCKNPTAMRVKAQNYGFYRLEFYAYDELQNIECGKTIVIDELRDYFEYCHGVTLGGFNLTNED